MARISERSRLVLAHHEAGHAVALKVAGYRVTDVRIHPSDNGSTNTADDPDPNDPMPWLVMLMAGAAAEVRYLRTVEGKGSWAAESIAARSLTYDLPMFRVDSRGTGISQSTARSRADRLVAKHWKRIHRAAVALDHKGRLSGSSI